MKILYLYAEIMGYTMSSVRELVELGNEVHIVHWDHKKLTPYIAPEMAGVFLYNRSQLSVDQIMKIVSEISPDIAVISGWMDKGYLQVARKLRRKGLAVVVGLDSHWSGTLSQRLMAFMGRAGFLSRFYSHAWVAGLRQFEFARKLGFSSSNIVYDLYSADSRLFNQVFNESFGHKQGVYPHRFLFIGRFESVKGLDVLLDAWKLLGEKKGDWQLHLIGNGTLKDSTNAPKSVVIKDFMQPDLLANEIALSGCFLLPSRSEPWGVVVHEMAASGLPLLLSDAVGAASTFLIPGFNGFSFTAGDPIALSDGMFQIINMSDEELLQLAVNSQLLSNRISPITSARNLLSAIEP